MKKYLLLMALLIAGCAGTTVERGTSSTFGSPDSSTTTIASTTTTTESGQSTPTSPELPGYLLVMGDWGSGTAPQGAVAGAMARFAEENPVDALLTTGDNFYSDDADFLMAPYEWVADLGIDWWITWGNHDVETSRRVDAVEEAFASPPRWAIYEWGAIDIMILDSTQVDSPIQRVFVADEMAASTNPTIVIFHHPAFSCSRHGDTDDVIEQWIPLFDEDVVLVMSGHDHNYQRIEDRRTYIVSGGGGRPLYEIEPCDHDLINSRELHHFVVLRQDDNVIHGTAVDVNGAPFDEFFVDLEPGVLDG